MRSQYSVEPQNFDHLHSVILLRETSLHKTQIWTYFTETLLTFTKFSHKLIP